MLFIIIRSGKLDMIVIARKCDPIDSLIGKFVCAMSEILKKGSLFRCHENFVMHSLQSIHMNGLTRGGNRFNSTTAFSPFIASDTPAVARGLFYLGPHRVVVNDIGTIIHDIICNIWRDASLYETLDMDHIPVAKDK